MRGLLILLVGLIALAPRASAEEREAPAPTAKGRTGPVGLQLTLFQKKIRVGQRLFVKTRLTNFSKDPMSVVDWIYRGSRNLGEEWSNNSCNRVDPDIEVRDSMGRRLKPIPYADLSGGDSPFAQKVGPARTDDRLKGWRSEGLSDSQINERLRKEDSAHAEKERDAQYPVVALRPGRSVESVSWCSGAAAGKNTTAIVCPGNGFVELPIYTFERPGRYRIRAVRDARMPKELRKWSDQWSVRTETDWITFEVVR